MNAHQRRVRKRFQTTWLTETNLIKSDKDALAWFAFKSNRTFLRRNAPRLFDIAVAAEQLERAKQRFQGVLK